MLLTFFHFSFKTLFLSIPAYSSLTHFTSSLTAFRTQIIESLITECKPSDCRWGITYHFSDEDISHSLPNYPIQMLLPHLLERHILVLRFVVKTNPAYFSPVYFNSLSLDSLQFISKARLEQDWKKSRLVLAFYTF